MSKNTLQLSRGKNPFESNWPKNIFMCFVYILWLQLTLTHIFASGFQNVCTTRKTSEALVTVPGLD